MKRKFTFSFDRPVDEAIKELSELFTYHSIKFSAEPNSIHSTQIPIALTSWDGRQYSKHNWTGINPFLFVDNINAIASEDKNHNSTIQISIQSNRVYVLIAIPLFLSLMLCGTPDYYLMIFPLGISLIISLFIYFVILGSALPNEIKNKFQPAH